jgi:zinc transport system ATP-binding protein
LNIGFCAQNKVILKNINLVFSEKEITTIIGPNGAGKTTLLKIMLNLLKPTEGKVKRAPNLKISYVPQKMDLSYSLPLTVEHFLLLNDDVDKKDIDLFLDRVGALKLKKEQLFTLSGGEWQRVLLSRALIRRPKVLFLDEPTQGMDVIGRDELYAHLVNVRDELHCSVILVSHDLHIVFSESDKIICLNQHICCQGSPKQVKESKEYQNLFGLYLKPYKHLHDHKHD